MNSCFFRRLEKRRSRAEARAGSCFHYLYRTCPGSASCDVFALDAHVVALKIGDVFGDCLDYYLHYYTSVQ